MNYLREHKKKKISFFTLSVFFVIALLVIFQPTVPSPLVQAFHSIGIPIWRIENSISASISDFFSTFSSKEALIEENQRLEKEIDLLRFNLLATSLIQEENKLLKEVFGRRVSEDSIVASVLTRPNISPYDTLVIDVGKEEGVFIGNKILVNGTIVIGEITNVYEKTSTVELFSSPGRETEIYIGESLIQAKAKGLGGGNFDTELPRDIDIKNGDSVVMPGINPILFSIVEEIIKEPTDSFQRILFKNPVNMMELYFVEVI